jgi:hypothetical protein
VLHSFWPEPEGEGEIGEAELRTELGALIKHGDCILDAGMARLGLAFKSFFAPSNAIPSIVWGLVFLAVPTVISVIVGAILTLSSFEKVLLGIASLLLLVAVALGWRYQHMPIPVATTASNTVPTRANPAALAVRHHSEEPYESAVSPTDLRKRIYVGIHNPPGNPAAAHVRVEILRMEPWPRNDHGQPPTFNTPIPSRRESDANTGLTLPPGAEDYWEIATVGRDGEGNFYVQGIAAANSRHSRWHLWSFYRDEDWRLHYRAWSDNVPAVEFTLRMLVVKGDVQCRLEGT